MSVDGVDADADAPAHDPSGARRPSSACASSTSASVNCNASYTEFEASAVLRLRWIANEDCCDSLRLRHEPPHMFYRQRPDREKIVHAAPPDRATAKSDPSERRASDPLGEWRRPPYLTSRGRAISTCTSIPLALRDRSKRTIGINDTTVGTEQRHAVGKPLERLLKRAKGAVIGCRNWHMPWLTSHREAHHRPRCTRHARSHAPTAGITSVDRPHHRCRPWHRLLPYRRRSALPIRRLRR